MTGVRYRIEARGLTQRFGRNVIFKNLNFALETGSSFCITGANGSGKSTLLKILAVIQAPADGSVTYADISRGALIKECSSCIGYTGPLVNPYDDLTALENIYFASGRAEKSRIDSLLKCFHLTGHEDKKIRHYSSGMKQRLRIILADLNDPPILILDEPGTNLDESGRRILRSYLDSVSVEKAVILATNDRDEEKLCGRGIRLG